jgi:hypothetical protein
MFSTIAVSIAVSAVVFFPLGALFGHQLAAHASAEASSVKAHVTAAVSDVRAELAGAIADARADAKSALDAAAKKV